MFSKLLLKNFRSHKDTLIHLFPGLNVLTGTSCYGKTNIQRALDLLAFNKPSGYRYHSRFAGKAPTEVHAETDEGNEVSVIKHKTTSKSHFLVNGAQYKGLKKSQIPDEVTTALNLGEINFQRAHTKHYLITSTPAEIAKEINRVTGLGIGDVWVSDLAKLINKQKQQITFNEDQLSSKKQSLKAYEQLEDVTDLIKNIDKLKLKLEQLEDELNDMNVALDLLKTSKVVNAASNKLTLAEKKLNSIEELSNKLEALTEELELIDEYFEQKEEDDNITIEYEKTKLHLIFLLRKTGKCPLCLSDVTESCIQHFISGDFL